jgi:hypothetical protein
MATVFNILIDQGETWEKRLYVTTQKVLTAYAASTTKLPGSTSIVIAPGGVGAIVAGEHVQFSGHAAAKTYIVETGVADLSVGGTLVLSTPITEQVTGDSLKVFTPTDLTGAVLNSQIRPTADSATVTATVVATLAATPTLGYFDLSLSDTVTSAIPTTGKTSYDKLAKYTWDGEIVKGGKVVRSYNGTVTVSPNTTRSVTP